MESIEALRTEIAETRAEIEETRAEIKRFRQSSPDMLVSALEELRIRSAVNNWSKPNSPSPAQSLSKRNEDAPRDSDYYWREIMTDEHAQWRWPGCQRDETGRPIKDKDGNVICRTPPSQEEDGWEIPTPTGPGSAEATPAEAPKDEDRD